MTTSGGEVALSQSREGDVRLEVRVERESVWLTQAQMSELFGRERSVITKHVNNVFGEGERAKKGNVQMMRIASADRANREGMFP